MVPILTYSIVTARAVLHIDPNSRLRPLWAKLRPGDQLLTAGVGASLSSMKYFHINPDVLSTLSEEQANSCVEQGHEITGIEDVAVKPLNQIVEELCFEKRFDLLNIDVEGLEVEVLETLNIPELSPSCIIVETLTYNRLSPGAKRLESIEFLTQRGYKHVADTYLNSIFIHDRVASEV